MNRRRTPTAMNTFLRALCSFRTCRQSQPASGKASAQRQDKARTVALLGVEAAAGTIKNIGPAAVFWRAVPASLRTLPCLVVGWRFAPACCAAQSVLRCGPCCTVALVRLAWATCRFVPVRGLRHQVLARSCCRRAWPSLSRSAAVHKCGLTGRSTGPIAACGQKPAISFWAFSHMPQRSG